MIETNSIGAKFVDQFVGIGIIAQPLGHLVAVFGKNDAIDDDVFKCRLIEKSDGENVQGIKPAARLIEPFRDKIGRKAFFGQFFVFKGIVILRIRHRTRFKPAVKHFRNAPINLPIFFKGQIVDEMAMQIVIFAPVSFSSSWIEPMTTQSPSSFLQMGIGVPQ